jgi:hypothetical protein
MIYKGRLWKWSSVHRGHIGGDGRGTFTGTIERNTRYCFIKINSSVGNYERYVKGGFGNGQFSSLWSLWGTERWACCSEFFGRQMKKGSIN